MIDLVKKYVENRIQLVKLNLIAAISNVAAGLVSSFLLLVIALLIVLMFSIALAFWISSYFESEVVGFGLVGLIYLLFFVVYAVFAKDGVEKRIKDKIIASALSDEGEIEETLENEE